MHFLTASKKSHVRSKAKVMMSVLLNYESILNHKYAPECVTTNQNSYSQVFRRTLDTVFF
jgi:hypothetical protein